MVGGSRGVGLAESRVLGLVTKGRGGVRDVDMARAKREYALSLG